MQKGRAYSSTLRSVPGVGPATAKALLAHFKTVSAVKEASEEQLAAGRAGGGAGAHFQPQPARPSAET
ncbi:MAG: helix-hairpin-helix domain-containing protein [Ruthenibacterium lactatiformans]